jgi:dolichyl-phosphate-mannose-protein mannosyltransferase
LYVVISEALLRRRAGDGSWFTNGILKQGPITFLNLVPISLVVYLVSWSGWIFSSGGYARNWSEANPATGFFSVIPNWLQSLWHYHQVAYNFHVGLTTEHSYASHPLTWLLGIRPTAFFYEGAVSGSPNCSGATDCSSAITALGNPAIWWFATAAVLFLVYLFIRYQERMIGLILLGLAAGYLPWLLFSGRTMYQFYAVSFQPWMILALVLTIQLLLYKQDPEGRTRAKRYVASYFALVSLLAVFFAPIYLGTWIPFWYWQAHMWLPSWI